RNCLRMRFIILDGSRDWLAEARDAAQRAVELRPDLGETHDALGWYFYQGLGDYGRAVQEFAVARNLQPSNSDALFGIGSVLRRQGRWGESADAMARALEIDPKNPTILVNFAASCVLARRYAEADKAFKAAVVLNPHFGGPYGRRAWLQVQWRGDVDRARAILDQAARVGDLSDDQAILADARLSVALVRRDFEGALRTLDAEPRAAYSNQLRYSPIDLLRGTVQLLAGRQEAARRSFEAARIVLEARAAQTPGDARVHSALAVAYAGLGRRDDAVKEADRGCELTPDSKDAWLALERGEDRAEVFVLVGRNADAIAQLDDLLQRSGETTAQVLQLDPTWDHLRSELGFQKLIAKYEVRE
ncbi:MAG: tetratricopeptide repeat protein, partial [Acidobacteriota bacterium]